MWYFRPAWWGGARGSQKKIRQVRENFDARHNSSIATFSSSCGILKIIALIKPTESVVWAFEILNCFVCNADMRKQVLWKRKISNFYYFPGEKWNNFEILVEITYYKDGQKCHKIYIVVIFCYPGSDIYYNLRIISFLAGIHFLYKIVKFTIFMSAQYEILLRSWILVFVRLLLLLKKLMWKGKSWCEMKVYYGWSDHNLLY